PETLIAHRDAGGLRARRARRETAAGLALPAAQAAPEGAAPGRLGGGRTLARRDPLEMLFRDFIQEAGTHAVARLAVQHAALRQGQGQAFARARESDVHETALFFQAA